jgi:NAD(P)-dependent dehydrogenase (short-subunit alcohol dehydrogenase family)
MNEDATMRFEGRVTLVTGANRNTGLAIAEAFAREGATVWLNGRNAAELAQVADNLRKTSGATVHEALADIGAQEQVDALFERIRQTSGRLDILVNNAVNQGMGHTLIDTPQQMLEDVFRINVFGAYACAQAAAKIMALQKSGTIINIGSNTAERAIRNRTAYVASKAAVDGLTRAMAVELGPMGIRVNSVVAGYIRTERWDTLAEGVEKRRLLNVPLQAEAGGNDIAEAVLFLASDAAARINGTRLVVDGGSLVQLYPADCEA